MKGQECLSGMLSGMAHNISGQDGFQTCHYPWIFCCLGSRVSCCHSKSLTVMCYRCHVVAKPSVLKATPGTNCLNIYIDSLLRSSFNRGCNKILGLGCPLENTRDREGTGTNCWKNRHCSVLRTDLIDTVLNFWGKNCLTVGFLEVNIISVKKIKAEYMCRGSSLPKGNLPL